MRFLSLAIFLVGLFGATFAVVTAPDAFEFGGYIQQGLTHILVAVSTLAITYGASNLLRD